MRHQATFGEPSPEEAVMKAFQRALPFCDGKRLYLALVDILERTGQVRNPLGFEATI